MKIQFWLLDINYEIVDGKPEVRLWGLDSNGNRVLVCDRTFFPYFYLLLEDSEKIDGVVNEIERRKKEHHLNIYKIEKSRKKFFGRDVDVVKVVCEDPDVLTEYAESMAKIKGVKDHLEDDIRFSMRYIIDNDLSPCCWHEIEVEEKSEYSNIQVDKVYEASAPPKVVEKTEVPNLKVLAFSIICYSKKGTPKPSINPVIIISVTNSDGQVKQFVSSNSDDGKILKDFMNFIESYNPDIIVGYGNNKIDWPFLLGRARANGMKLTVDRIRAEPHTSLYGHVSVTGRANLDLFDLAGDLPEVKVKTLENVAEFLGIAKKSEVPPIEDVDIPYYWEDPKGKDTLIKFSLERVKYILAISEAMLDFTMQLSSLTGLPLDHVAAAAVGFRVDSYLMKQAHKLGELIPRRLEQPYIPYKGAVVLAPKTGIHENIAVLDFTAMYPNLMMLYNISPDTFIKPDEPVPKEDVTEIPDVNYKFRRKPPGFYKLVLSNLIAAREKIKKRLKELDPKSVEYKILKAREKSVKVITNAVYGYAGWIGARWYVREVAESTAALGRVTIQKAINVAKKMSLDVVYSDTDSVFVKYEPEKINKLLKWAEDEVKIEIKPEKIYERILFTEAKKRYAGLSSDGAVDVVGLEAVRGDWSNAAKIVQEKVIELILKDKSPGRAVEYFKEFISNLKNGKVPYKELIIWKTLTKPIEEYEVRAPHVEVAKILSAEGWELTLGDKVGYVITKGPGKLYEKAKPYVMARLEDIDFDYYVNNQVLPAALRILELFGVTEQQLLTAEKAPSLTEFMG
jgi:DNA polymerase I